LQAPRVVFVCDRRAEERHHPIARVLIERALDAMNAFGEDLEEALHNPGPVLGVDRLREIHRPLHIGEEHGHVLALAFEGAAATEDLLGKVLRRV
jgi:hypothetical protein